MRAMILGLAMTTALIGAAHAQALAVESGTYAVDPTHASLTWRVSHLGFSNYTARFTKFTATINLNAQDPTQSAIDVTIDPNSVRTDFPDPQRVDFDKEIGAGERFLNGAAFPEITFKSTRLERTSATTGLAYGNLTLRGVTKPVALAVTLNAAKPHPFNQRPTIGVSAVGMIKRSEFGMTALVPNIGDDVMLVIEAEFQRQG